MKTPKNKKSFALISIFLISIFFLNINALETSKEEYQQDLERINAFNKSFKQGLVNNLEEYEKFANEIQKKWNEDYAKLMLEICKPLSSGTFESRRRFDLAREYALSALNEPNKITLDTELELIGHVMTNTGLPFSPKEQELVQRRKKDIDIRLHAWKRLTDAVDPKWDPNDLPKINITPPPSTGLPSGIAPEAIQDPKLRAEYEKAIEQNEQKAKKYSEQYELHKWLKKYPDRAEKYIIQLYSAEPYDTEELKQLLEKYKIDQEVQTRIINAVESNIKKEAETQERLNRLRRQ